MPTQSEERSRAHVGNPTEPTPAPRGTNPYTAPDCVWAAPPQIDRWAIVWAERAIDYEERSLVQLRP